MSIKRWKPATSFFVVVVCLFTALEGITQVAGIQAPGTPIFNCDGDSATLDRLLSGLPAQEEAIKRTEAMLKALKDQSADARDKFVLAAVKALNAHATSIAKSSEVLLAKEEGLKAAGISAEAARRWKWLENVKSIAHLSDALADATEAPEKLVQSYSAGKAYGNAVFVDKTARALSQQIEATNRLLTDSGIKQDAAEEFGAKLAEVAFGPIGETSFRAIVALPDLLLSVDSSMDADKVEGSLESMRSSYSRIRGRIYELKQELAQDCSKDTAKAEKQSPPPKHGHTGLIVGGVLAGVGAGGAAAAARLQQNQNQNQNSSPGGSCVTLPIACTQNSQCACGGNCADFGGSGICQPK